MSGSTSTPERNRRRSSRGGRGAATARVQTQEQAGAAAESRTVRTQQRRAAGAQGGATRRQAAVANDIPRNEVLGRLLLAVAVALTFVSVFASLVSGGVVLPLVIATVAVGVVGGVLFALARLRG